MYAVGKSLGRGKRRPLAPRSRTVLRLCWRRLLRQQTPVPGGRSTEVATRDGDILRTTSSPVRGTAAFESRRIPDPAVRGVAFRSGWQEGDELDG
jgi:hypothetical protein